LRSKLTGINAKVGQLYVRLKECEGNDFVMPVDEDSVIQQSTDRKSVANTGSTFTINTTDLNNGSSTTIFDRNRFNTLVEGRKPSNPSIVDQNNDDVINGNMIDQGQPEVKDQVELGIQTDEFDGGRLTAMSLNRFTGEFINIAEQLEFTLKNFEAITQALNKSKESSSRVSTEFGDEKNPFGNPNYRDSIAMQINLNGESTIHPPAKLSKNFSPFIKTPEYSGPRKTIDVVKPREIIKRSPPKVISHEEYLRLLEQQKSQNGQSVRIISETKSVDLTSQNPNRNNQVKPFPKDDHSLPKPSPIVNSPKPIINLSTGSTYNPIYNNSQYNRVSTPAQYVAHPKQSYTHGSQNFFNVPSMSFQDSRNRVVSEFPGQRVNVPFQQDQRPKLPQQSISYGSNVYHGQQIRLHSNTTFK